MPSPRHAAAPSDIISDLAQRGLLGKVWPVFRHDPSPSIYALMVPRSVAVAELNFGREGEPVTDADLVAAIRGKGILDHHQHVPDQRKLKRKARP